MDLNKKLEELKPYQLNCNVFDVYSYNGLSMQDLLCQFFTKINECITVSNETIDLAKWLVNEGLEIEVVKKLMIWLEDGTLENIINVNLFNTLNEKINGLSSQLEHITKIIYSNSNNIQNEINQITDNTNVKFIGTFELDDVLLFSNLKNVSIDLTNAKFICNKHGYGCIEISECKNIQIKNGELLGTGVYYLNSWDTGSLTNEKYININTWGMYRNGEFISTTYNNGNLGNFGIGLLIHNGCENIVIDSVKAHNFNGCGISIGFIGDGYNDSHTVDYSDNITIKNCSCYDNFDCGIQVLQVTNYTISNNKCYNNGHPNANKTDQFCDPGYGITIRGNLFCAENGIIENNKCYNNKRKGLDAHAGKNFKFINNYIENSYNAGIEVTSYGNNPIENYEIVGNKIVNCANGGNELSTRNTAILADGDTLGIVTNNTIIDSGNNGILNSSNRAIEGWKGEKIIDNNTIINSGLNECILCSQEFNYASISKNKILSSESDCGVKIYGDSNTTNKFANIDNNHIQTKQGVFLRYLDNGTCKDNSFNCESQEIIYNWGNVVSSNNTNIKNMTYANHQANLGTNIGNSYVIPISFSNGKISMVDGFKVVESIESIEQGIRINLKNKFIGGCVVGVANSSGNNTYQNIYVRNTGDYNIDIGIGTTISHVGIPGNTIDNLLIHVMFTTL